MADIGMIAVITIYGLTSMILCISSYLYCKLETHILNEESLL